MRFEQSLWRQSFHFHSTVVLGAFKLSSHALLNPQLLQTFYLVEKKKQEYFTFHVVHSNKMLYYIILEGMYDTENLQLPVTTKKAHQKFPSF